MQTLHTAINIKNLSDSKSAFVGKKQRKSEK